MLKIHRGGGTSDSRQELFNFRSSIRYKRLPQSSFRAVGIRCCWSQCEDSTDCKSDESCDSGECVLSALACGDFNGVCNEGETCENGLCCLNGRCSSPMVYIPEGAFMMGCNYPADPNCNQDGIEEPYHEVNVPEFQIDVTEVTVEQYRACVEDNRCSEPSAGGQCNWVESDSVEPDKADHPVNCITWIQSKEYCEWGGKRLCSESEWEKAARGTDGRIYPWGNHEPTCNEVVMDDDGVGCGEDGTWSVGSKLAGIYGLYDMVGNINEWVEDDWHNNYEGGPDDGSPWVSNPRLEYRVFRGGCFDYNSASELRAPFRYRNNPDSSYILIGTRCCR